jgi:regulator of nonsense transcripts 2
MYAASLVSGQVILQQLYQLINFGHEIPEALREASSKAATEISQEDSAPVYNSASGVSRSIMEDEEMEEQDLETKEETRAQQSQPVAVSIHSKFDPRVPSKLDPPNSVFRVKLVCTLLEVASKALVSRSNIPKVEAFLTAFQRYLFTKNILPAEVEFALLDTFDLIDSLWRKVQKDQKKKTPNEADDESPGFPRYRTWLEAHNATVAYEEAEAAAEARARVRLEALAGNGDLVGAENATVASVASDFYNEEEDGLDDEEDSDSGAEDAMSTSARDSLIDEHDSEHISVDEGFNNEVPDDQEDSQATGTVDGEDSDDDSSSDSDEDGSDEEFDQEAYMRQLEAEAFEAELRRLTMEALDKGKANSRTGKVSDTMPSGSQFIRKKQGEAAESQGPTIALGGKEGISFNLLKKGNKGKMEAKQFFVPKDTNLAAVASKQDDEAARERDMIKAKVLQYEAESAESTGGNVYLEQEKLTVIRNRPLSMDEIDKNFGTTGGNLVNLPGKKSAVSGAQTAGRGGSYSSGGRGRGYSGGRGTGRGRGRTSGSGRGLV